MNTIAMNQNKVSNFQHIVRRHCATFETGGHQQPPPPSLDWFSEFDQLMHAAVVKDRVVVRINGWTSCQIINITFIVYLDDYISIAMIEDPVCCVLHCIDDGRFIFKVLILPEIKISENNRHAKLVRMIEYSCEPAHIFLIERAVFFERWVYPLLTAPAAVPKRTSSLEVKGKSQ